MSDKKEIILLKKKEDPEENEIVLCEVEALSKNSVFVRLIEYEDYKGIIPIFEVAPGRIRNIRDYVTEGKIIVCYILNCDKPRRNVTLSLRRVNEGQRRNKISWLKQEQDAEKILELVAEKKNVDLKELFQKVYDTMPEEYNNLYNYFQAISSNEIDLKADLDEAVKSELLSLIKQRIKPKEVVIVRILRITSLLPDGIEVIRDAFSRIGARYQKISMQYLGSGKYSIKLKDKEYKIAEKKLKDIIDELNNLLENKADLEVIQSK